RCDRPPAGRGGRPRGAKDGRRQVVGHRGGADAAGAVVGDDHRVRHRPAGGHGAGRGGVVALGDREVGLGLRGEAGGERVVPREGVVDAGGLPQRGGRGQRPRGRVVQVAGGGQGGGRARGQRQAGPAARGGVVAAGAGGVGDAVEAGAELLRQVQAE